MATKEIRISGIIGWDVTPGGVKEQLDAANGGDVHFTFASPGGFVSPGLEIFNMIRSYPGKVSGTLSGVCASMCSYIPMAVALNYKNPGKLDAEDNAIFMIHNAWGYAVGDHNAMLKRHDALKGMSKILGKAYAKRTGKSPEDIAAMMDQETYLYGDEIMDAGFCDEIIAAAEPDADDKDSAMLTARAAVEDVQGRMSADQASVKADFAKMAAFLTDHQPQAHQVPTPALAGNSTQEEQQMKLSDLLAANPEARAEYEANLATARKDGETAAKENVTAAANVLGSDAYPSKIKAVALNVLKGEESRSTLTTVVAVFDAMKEEGSSTAAAASPANGVQTPPAQPTAHKPGEEVASEDALQQEIARMKGGK